MELNKCKKINFKVCVICVHVHTIGFVGSFPLARQCNLYTVHVHVHNQQCTCIVTVQNYNVHVLALHIILLCYFTTLSTTSTDLL